MFAKRNAKGELVKRAYGPWVMKAFRILARMKGLRGTAFDPFGRTEERRTERRLVDEYRALSRRLLADLTPENIATAVELASVPEGIRGYGHVKERHLAEAGALKAKLLERFEMPEVASEVRRATSMQATN